MVAPKTLSCVLLVVIGFLIVAHANASEEEWNDEVFEETVADDSIGRRKCPRKEHYDKCKASCDKTCFNYNENPGACEADCKPGCICDRGYVRGPDGSCIKPKQCPSTRCPSGEHYNRCLLNCQRDCSNWNATHIPCTQDCTPGCLCDEGTVRSSLPNGKCIKPEECKAPEENEEGLPIPFLCRKKHEEYSICPSLCADNCTNYQDNKRACKLVCLPIPGCVCKSGYIKGPDGVCIKPDQCPADKRPEDCTELEQYTTCGTSCEDNCDNYQEKDRDCGNRCNVGCFCLPGYVRGPKGDCIFPFDCPAKSSRRSDSAEESEVELKNSEYTTPVEEESTRDPKYDRFPEDIDNSEIEYKKEEAYEPRMFPQSLFCKKDQFYSLCPSLCPDNCTNYQDTTRACKIVCLPLPACVCKSGFVVGPDGTCIKPGKCHKDQKPDDCLDNEYYDTCGSQCPPDCKNYNSDESKCDKKCVIGCFCRPGMVKGPDGKCIWPFECELKASNSEGMESVSSDDSESSFCPRHEEYDSCKAYAELDCSNRTTLPKTQEWCLAGCRCQPGYVRGPHGNCIRPEECPDNDNTEYPVQRVCPKDETWSLFAQCQRNCSDPARRLCPRMSSPGCVCKDGFLRNLEGMCVPRNECPENQQGVGIRDNSPSAPYPCPDLNACRQSCGSKNGVCAGLFCICF